MDIDPKIRAKQDRRLMYIGSICEQWSFLEYVLLRSMRKLIGSSDVELGKILFGGLDIRPRLAMAIELAKHFKAAPELIKALEDTRHAVDSGLLKRRNRAVHGVQFLYTDGEIEVEVHRGKDRKRRPISATDLWQISEDIHATGRKLCVAINHYLWDVEAPPYTLLEKPAKQPRKPKTPKPDQKPKPRARPPRSSRG